MKSKDIISNQISCYDMKTYQIESQTCVKQKCELVLRLQKALQKDPQLPTKLVGDGHGNPGYHLCEKLNAKTYFVNVAEVFKSPGIEGVGICVVDADHSFADVGSLLQWAGFGISKR